jgi:hypothetical protein
MSAWTTIRSAINTTMTAVNELSANAFYESPMGIEVSRLPRSPKLNGAYSIHMNGIPQFHRETGDSADAEIAVRVQLGFVMNNVENADPDDGALQNEKTDYTNAVQDIVLIIRTFFSTAHADIEIKDFSRAGDLRPLDASETYFI